MFVCDGLCDVVWLDFVCLFCVWLVVRASVLCDLVCDVVCVAAVSVYLCACLNVFVRVV